VLAELMNDDGTVMRGADVQKFAASPWASGLMNRD
jgi:hypothetical protein